MLRSSRDIISRYDIQLKIGEGASGHVYRVFDRHHDRHVALKATCNTVAERNWLFNEILIGIYLQKLSIYTDVFLPIIDWWLAERNTFNLNLEGGVWDNDKIVTYFGFTMPLAKGNLYGFYDLTRNDLIDIFFELVYGYWVAYHLEGFLHRDIALRNILYFTNHEYRVYKLQGRDYLLTTTYHAVFSDYESVIFLNPSNPYYQVDLEERVTDNIHYFVDTLAEILDASSINDTLMTDFVKSLKINPIQDWFQLLTTTPLFETLRNNSNLGQTPVKIFASLP